MNIRLKATLIWLAGFVLIMLVPVVAFFLKSHPYSPFREIEELGKYFESICKATLPTLIVMTGYWFKDRKDEVTIDREAGLVLILLLAGYLIGVLGTVVASLVSQSPVPLIQKCDDALSWTSAVQPLISAPLLYMFGKGSANAEGGKAPAGA